MAAPRRAIRRGQFGCFRSFMVLVSPLGVVRRRRFADAWRFPRCALPAPRVAVVCRMAAPVFSLTAMIAIGPVDEQRAAGSGSGLTGHPTPAQPRQANEDLRFRGAAPWTNNGPRFRIGPDRSPDPGPTPAGERRSPFRGAPPWTNNGRRFRIGPDRSPDPRPTPAGERGSPFPGCGRGTPDDGVPRLVGQDEAAGTPTSAPGTTMLRPAACEKRRRLPAGRMSAERHRGRRLPGQSASGSGRTWNFSMPGFTPRPPSMCQVAAAP